MIIKILTQKASKDKRFYMKTQNEKKNTVRREEIH